MKTNQTTLLVAPYFCLFMAFGCSNADKKAAKEKPSNDLVYFHWSTGDEKGGVTFNKDGTGVLAKPSAGRFTVERFRYSFVDKNTVDLEIGSGWEPAQPDATIQKVRLKLVVSETTLETTDPEGNTIKYAKRGKASEH